MPVRSKNSIIFEENPFFSQVIKVDTTSVITTHMAKSVVLITKPCLSMLAFQASLKV